METNELKKQLDYLTTQVAEIDEVQGELAQEVATIKKYFETMKEYMELLNEYREWLEGEMRKIVTMCKENFKMDLFLFFLWNQRR